MKLYYMCLCVFLQSEYKLFGSPSDYGEKVMGKIREFNGSVDQVLAIMPILLECHLMWK